MSIRVAGLQTRGTPADVDANLAELGRAAHTARAEGVDLLITPEMFVTGYDIGDRLHSLASRDFVTPVRELARRTGVAIVLGAPEQAPEGLYNTASFIDVDGSLLGSYRKAHLFGDLDRSLFVAGSDAYAMVDFRGVRIALLICYDVEFPETVRAAAMAGVHLIAVPTAQMTPFTFVAEQVVRARAWENQVYVAYVNHDGSEGAQTYVGRSSIVDPYAAVVDSLEHGNGLVYATVDPDVVAEAQRDNPYLTDRRPELY